MEPSCVTPYPPSPTTVTGTGASAAAAADEDADAFTDTDAVPADVDADVDETALASLSPDCKQRCQCPPGKVWDAHAHAGAGAGLCKARIDCPLASPSSGTDDDAVGGARGSFRAAAGSWFLGVEQGETAVLLCFIAAFAAIAALRHMVRAARGRAGTGLPFVQQQRRYGTSGSGTSNDMSKHKLSNKVSAGTDQQGVPANARESPGVPSWPPAVRTGTGSQFDADSGDDANG